MNDHLKTKQHKKRFRECTTVKPYTHEEAERAGGLFRPQIAVWENYKNWSVILLLLVSLKLLINVLTLNEFTFND